MTYRLDSDIPRPYGWLSELGSTQLYPPSNLAWRPPRPLSQVSSAVKNKTLFVTSSDKYKSLSRLQAFMCIISQEERAARAHPKPRLVAWLVSNCNTHSNREEYVELLRRHVPVGGQQPCHTVQFSWAELLFSSFGRLAG